MEYDQDDQDDPTKQRLYYSLDGSKTKRRISNKTILYRSGIEDGVSKQKVQLVPREASIDSYTVSYKTMSAVEAPEVAQVLSETAVLASSRASPALVIPAPTGPNINTPADAQPSSPRHDCSGWKDIDTIATTRKVIITKHFKLSMVTSPDKLALAYILEYDQDDQDDPTKQRLYYSLDGSKTNHRISNKTILYRSGIEDGVSKQKVQIVPMEASIDSYTVSYKTMSAVKAPEVAQVSVEAPEVAQPDMAQSDVAQGSSERTTPTVRLETADTGVQHTTTEANPTHANTIGNPLKRTINAIKGVTQPERVPAIRVRVEERDVTVAQRNVAQRDPVETWWRNHAVARDVLCRVKSNPPSLTVLNITTCFYGAPTGVISGLLRAVRDYNTHIEVLEMSNVGITQNQLTIVVNLLQRGHVWSINLGETNDISNDAWCDCFANHVESTNLCCMYASLQHPKQKQVKDRIQASLRANRVTEKRWRMESRVDTLKQYKKKNWWNPPTPPKDGIGWWPNPHERELLGDSAEEMVQSMDTHGALVHRRINVLLVVNRDEFHTWDESQTNKMLEMLIDGLQKEQCTIYVSHDAETSPQHNGCHYMLNDMHKPAFIANIDAAFGGVHFRHILVCVENVKPTPIFCHNMGGLLRRLDGHSGEGLYIPGDPTILMNQPYFIEYAHIVPHQDMRLVHSLDHSLPLQVPPNMTTAYLKSLFMARRK